jgi:hypothetical protein
MSWSLGGLPLIVALLLDQGAMLDEVLDGVHRGLIDRSCEVLRV